jgi:hypothetical protein
MCSKWWPERFTISDDAGRARFEVRNIPGFTTQLSLSVIGREEIAVIRRRRGRRFQVTVRGREAGMVRQRAAGRYDIQSALVPPAVAGDVADGRASLLMMCGKARTISVHIGDGDDAAGPLAIVLAIDAVQYERDGAYFNPWALLGLLNPFNWL